MSAESRNSPLRHITRGIVHSSAETLHNTFPNLTADQITASGVIGVGLASLVATDAQRNNSQWQRLAALGLMGASSLFDALDGPIARMNALKEGRTEGTLKGSIIDTAADRFQELLMALSRAQSAADRNDATGKILALTAGFTSSLPSLLKVVAQSQGKVVEEAGRNPIEFFGTRVGRAVLGIGATVHPKPHGIPFQKGADALTTAANMLTTYHRARVALSSPSPDDPIDPNKMSESRTYTKALMAVTLTVAGTELLAMKKIKGRSRG